MAAGELVSGPSDGSDAEADLEEEIELDVSFTESGSFSSAGQLLEASMAVGVVRSPEAKRAHVAVKEAEALRLVEAEAEQARACRRPADRFQR